MPVPHHVSFHETRGLKYAVLGAGGIGGLVGGALARAGHRVTLIVRPDAVSAHPRSLTVRSQLLGDFEAPVDVASTLEQEVDVVWVTVKANQFEPALASVPAGHIGRGLIIPLMNGIDHVARLRAVYPPGQVAAGTIRVESERAAPGRISQLSPFVVMQLAAAGPAASRVEAVAEEIRGSGLTCDAVTDEASMLWGKLVMLAPLALTTTAKAAPLGEVREDPTWRSRLERSVAEAVRAAQSEGATADVQDTMDRLKGLQESMRSSMQKDVEAGREPELEAIGGPIVRAGKRHGFDVSTTEELMRMISARAGRT